MAYFFDSTARTPRELLPGVISRTFWGERMLMSLVDLAPGANIPAHGHPHEQVGIVMDGEMEMTIGEETRRLKSGDIYVVPGGVSHSVRLGAVGCRAFEAFAPVREEYKFPD